MVQVFKLHGLLPGYLYGCKEGKKKGTKTHVVKKIRSGMNNLDTVVFLSFFYTFCFFLQEQ